MFLGPIEQTKPWNSKGIIGVHNFLKKLWKLYHKGGVFNLSENESTYIPIGEFTVLKIKKKCHLKL